ncbi:LOW QUALITY PROTEIN: spermatogenesis-associated protein 31D1-like [Psammomys obesus]|uniref:LOW QUALITY PROTEIN: spermatogenesis-associated protein 31D1-like n=1 Tax=Psammomys obesus TaxID=48139 RepID=UPI002452D072|nr:LOW QUALITY PROTEIN: spermatogenesis-associated protein 31D1-like [Psammomys obesus]
MENILSFLNTCTESWLSFGSAFFDTDSNYIFLSGVGFILLYLCYVILKPSLPSPWKSQDRKWRGTAKKGRRRSCKGYRASQRQTQEHRKLLSVVQSPIGELYDCSHFRQLLCPDPLCDVCNGATTKISRLLSQATHEDGAASVSSVHSTVSVTETSLTLSFPLPENPIGHLISDPPQKPSLHLSSIISPHQSAHLEDKLSASSLDDSLLSESIPVNAKFPLDHDSLYSLDSFPLPQQHATQETELLQSATILSLVGSPRKLFTNATINKGICSSGPAVSELMQYQTDAGNSSQLESAHSANLELFDLHFSESYLWGNTTSYLTLPGNLHSSSPNGMALLERQDGRREDSFTTWGKISESDQQNLAVSHPLESSNGQRERLRMHQQSPYPKTSEDQLEANPFQLFWGLPSLHSESMNSVASVWADSSHISGCFNRLEDSLMLTPHTQLSLPESLLQNSPQPLSPAQSQAQLQPPIPVLSSSPRSQLKICGVYFHRPKDEAPLLEPSAVHCLEYNILKKEQEKVWGLPTVVKTSQEKFCPPPPKPSLARLPSKTHVPRSISFGNFLLTNELQKKLEHHLRKRLILQRWGLPQRVLKSRTWMNPQAELPEPSSSASNYGLSWISFFKKHSNKDFYSIALNQPGSFPARQSGEKLLKEKGHSLETVQKHQQWRNIKGTLDNGLQSDGKTNLPHHSGSLSGKPSGDSEVSQCQNKLETSLQELLIRPLNKTNEGQVPGPMSRSGHHPLPFSSCVSIKDHKAQRQTPSDNKDEHIRTKKRMTKSVLPQTSIILDSTSLEKSEDNRHSPDVPRMSAKTGPVPLGRRLSSEEIVNRPQGANMNDKNAYVSNKISNIVKGGQLSGLQLQPTKIFNTSQYESAQGADGNTTEAQRTLLSGRAMKGISGPQETQTSDLNSQVSREEKFKSESSQPIQALEPQNSVLLVSEKFSYNVLLSQDPSSRPVDAAQVRQVRLSTAGPSVEQQQEPWMPPYVSEKGQNKELPPSAKKAHPPACKPGELGAGDAFLGQKE